MKEQNPTYPLRLPRGLRKAVGDYARREGTSINQFIAVAVAEKLSVLDTAQFFQDRGRDADPEAFRRLMQRQGGVAPTPEDRLQD